MQNKQSSTVPSMGVAKSKAMRPWKQYLINFFSAVLIFAGLGMVVAGLWAPVVNYIQIQRYSGYIVSFEDEAALDDPSLAAAVDEGVISVPVINAETGAVEENTLALGPTPTPRPTATPVPEPTLPADRGAVIAVPQDDPEPVAADPDPTATATSTPATISEELLNAPTEPTPTPTLPPYPPAENPPSRIVAESIGLDSLIVDVGWYETTIGSVKTSVWEVAEHAVGWHLNSAKPGHTGNIVLSGHHNVYGEVFRHLVDLEPGELVTLYADGIPYYYTVEDKKILPDRGEPLEVRKRNARWIGAFNDQRLTMVTCWPYSSNTHRVVVIAKPVINETTEQVN